MLNQKYKIIRSRLNGERVDSSYDNNLKNNHVTGSKYPIRRHLCRATHTHGPYYASLLSTGIRSVYIIVRYFIGRYHSRCKRRLSIYNTSASTS